MVKIKVYSSVLVLSFAAMVENLAYALPVSYFPDYVQLLGASVAYVGLFTAAFTAANAALPRSSEVSQTESEERS